MIDVKAKEIGGFENLKMQSFCPCNLTIEN